MHSFYLHINTSFRNCVECISRSLAWLWAYPWPSTWWCLKLFFFFLAFPFICNETGCWQSIYSTVMSLAGISSNLTLLSCRDNDVVLTRMTCISSLLDSEFTGISSNMLVDILSSTTFHMQNWCLEEFFI